MNRLLFAAALAATTGAALAGDNQGTTSIGQPDYYGLLDMINYQLPQLIYRNPLAIEQVPTYRQPVYLRVPPGHAKNWRKHCGEYHACGEQVLFVQDDWYNREYVPRYQEQHSDRRNHYGNKHSNGHHGNQNHYRDDRNGNDHNWWSQNEYRDNQNGYYYRGSQNDYHGDNYNDARDH
jgi:hypothetical protein